MHLSFIQHSQRRKRKIKRNGNPLNEPYTTSLEAIHSQNEPLPKHHLIFSFSPSPQTYPLQRVPPCLPKPPRPSISISTSHSPSPNLRALIHLRAIPKSQVLPTQLTSYWANPPTNTHPISLPHAHTPPDPALMQGTSQGFCRGDRPTERSSAGGATTVRTTVHFRLGFLFGVSGPAHLSSVVGTRQFSELGAVGWLVVQLTPQIFLAGCASWRDKHCGINTDVSRLGL